MIKRILIIIIIVILLVGSYNVGYGLGYNTMEKECQKSINDMGDRLFDCQMLTLKSPSCIHIEKYEVNVTQLKPNQTYYFSANYNVSKEENDNVL